MNQSPQPPAPLYDTNGFPYLESAIYILKEAIVILDRDFRVVFINQSAGQLAKVHLQYDLQPGDHYLDAVKKDRKQIVSSYLDAAFNDQVNSHRINVNQINKESWFELSYYPMPGEDGSISNVMLHARDVSYKVSLETQLESHKEAQKNKLIKAAIDAQEKQRTEIGKELHDNVNQVLTTIKLYNEICLTEEQTNKKLLLKSIQQVNYCIEALRSISKTLTGPALGEMNLADTIKELADSVTTTRRIEVKFYSYGLKNEKISDDLHTTIYRIAQEQLTNVLKYANASLVDVMLVGTSLSVALRIQDNGKGFDTTQNRKGVGITNMVTRTQTLNGQIDIQSKPGQGCTLMVEFPI
ncbi:MAG: ATP-binding protein [Flavisolibacter sp.]